VVSTGPELVIVPNLVDLSERDATAQLQALGLLVRVVDEYSEDVDPELVIRTDPVADTEVQLGDTVLIVVSLGPAPVEVPDLLGLNQAQAEAALEQRGLRMVASTQLVSDSSQHGRVIDQDPNPGDTLFPGDSVDVVFGEFIAPTTTTTAPTTTTTTTPPTTSG
jgi:serine/threonine-protein kinase